MWSHWSVCSRCGCCFQYIIFLYLFTVSDDVTKKLLVKVLSSLEDIRQTQKLHSSMIQNIIRRQQVMDEPVAGLPDGMSFPINSLAELDDVELQLSDTTARNLLVSRLHKYSSIQVDY